MTRTIIHCDRYGSIIETDRHLFRVEAGCRRGGFGEFDWCPQCASAPLAWPGE